MDEEDGEQESLFRANAQLATGHVSSRHRGATDYGSKGGEDYRS